MKEFRQVVSDSFIRQPYLPFCCNLLLTCQVSLR